ncbi:MULTISPECIES: 50S ribosomal protein L25/general stress protein Ctc [Streptomyces]|uniref:Large ribosomal subunit protein bL25 n=2 Tax=Streptomyces TaxID=1883 RepID=A0A3M8EWX4_9ACTN|nr:MULTISPECIES: 50S ribosomal protein L25/general stress protein Ctc [Streptomyces]MZE80552.1 50S ribosomal protein L25/general stress protein Ctc [Streptomyces sp. SID5475]KNE83133.1 50S ribosomal protein L25 [Streptomyces fradiae]OFA40838.1 50S ribosomal protein L25/general stress protein Ctc [Streptomyces fradiae]PQM20136.1 50S ribosomal protein L25 [Streptomyces xinghaiensis]RKM96061.1 50S ribosomal protein L25/general stress protein Ctc [Streptomyces xinghaiensis]
MAEVKIPAEIRSEFGKGAARRLRREEKVPGVVYGHGGEPVHVAIPGHELMMALKTPNVLIRLTTDGKSQLVIPKAVQREAIRGFLVHVDLLVVKKGETVTVDVPVHTEGELAPGGNLLEHMLDALPVETEATHIPEAFTVSVEGLEAGASIQAKDVTLPKGTALAVDGDTVVLQVVSTQAEAPAEGEEGEGEEA